MKALGTWKGDYQSLLEDGRGHTVTVDLPVGEEGDNLGPSALELCVLSLAGCITTIFALVAKKRRLKFEAMTVDLDTERPKGSPTISSVTGVLRVVTSVNPTDVETALRITLRTCPVGVLFEQAHVPVRVRAIVVPP
jgi:putative redox protein